MIKKLHYLTKENKYFDENGISSPRIVQNYEFAMFVESGGKFVIDGREHNINQWDIRLHKPGQHIYSYRFSEAYVLHIHKDFPYNHLLDMLPDHISCDNPKSFCSLFEEMISAYIKGDEISQIKLTHLEYEFIYRLLRMARFSTNSNSASREKLNSIKMAKTFIQSHFSEKIDLCDIAKSVNLHPNYLHKIFTSITDTTPHKYLTNIRISEAKRLLICSDLPLSAIADACGFDSVSYFISVFKHQNQMTPTQFRQANYTDVK